MRTSEAFQEYDHPELSSRNPAGHAGLLQNLFALVNALAAFFESALPFSPRNQKRPAVAITDTGWLFSFSPLLCALGYVS